MHHPQAMNRLNLYLYLFAIWLFIMPLHGHSQYQFDVITTTQGLSDNSINTIYQDQSGYVWIGTANGLNRFDGYAVITFKNNPKKDNSLSNNIINCIVEDKENNIWVGTEDGLNKYNPATKVFEVFRNNPQQDVSIASNQIFSLSIDDNGSLLIGTDKGLDIYTPSTKSFIHFSDITFSVYAMAQGKEGKYWLGTGDGLATLQHGKIVEYYKANMLDPTALSHEEVSAVLPTDNGVWAGTNFGGLNWLDWTTNTFSSYQNDPTNKRSLSDFTVTALAKDKNGTLWVGTTEGLNIFKPKSADFEVIQHHPDVPKGLSSSHILSLYADEEGNVWVGTNDKGINKLYLNKQNFSTFNCIEESCLPSKNVTAIYEGDDQVTWIGTKSGLAIYNKLKNTLTTLKHSQKEPSIAENHIKALIKDNEQNLWIATDASGIDIFNPNTHEYTHFESKAGDSLSLASNSTSCLMKDKNGSIWVGTNGGLTRFEKTGNNYLTTTYKNSANQLNSLSSDRIRALLQSKQGIIWIGTSGGGLNKFNPETNTFTRFQNAFDDVTTISDDYISCIFEDQQSEIWVGTFNGLNLLDQQTGKFKLYTEQDGLPNNIIYGILDDKQGNLWISTNNGLAKFNPSTETFRVYSQEDGLQDNQFNFGAYFKSPQGNLCFGGINGLNIFNPNTVKSNTSIPKVGFNSFQINDIEVLIKLGEKLQFTYNQNQLSFIPSAMSFAELGKAQIAYKLDGIDDEWTYLNKPERVKYPYLNPNKYQLLVRGANNDGLWSDPTVINFQIIEPIWTRWWFIVGCGIIAALIAYGIYKFRVRQIQAQKVILEGIVKDRTFELSQRNNELQSTLHTLQSTQSQLVQSEKMASLGQLTAGVAHEINNPINFVFGGAQTLKVLMQDVIEVLSQYDDLDNVNSIEELNAKMGEITSLKNELEFEETKEDAFHLIEDIRMGAERTAKIVQGLRNFTRLDEDILKPADIHEGLDSTLILLQSQIKETKIDIIKEYSNTLQPIDCYPGKLNQVFMNILNNAIQAIQVNAPEKKILITTTNLDNQVMISIRDTGKGIPHEIQKQIFDPFFTTKDVGKGTGLGLSISLGIIEKHQGTITLTSELEKGSEFIITLPKKHI